MVTSKPVCHSGRSTCLAFRRSPYSVTIDEQVPLKAPPGEVRVSILMGRIDGFN